MPKEKHCWTKAENLVSKRLLQCTWRCLEQESIVDFRHLRSNFSKSCCWASWFMIVNKTCMRDTKDEHCPCQLLRVRPLHYPYTFYSSSNCNSSKCVTSFIERVFRLSLSEYCSKFGGYVGTCAS